MTQSKFGQKLCKEEEEEFVQNQVENNNNHQFIYN